MTERLPHAAFPSDETLAAFIDGRLDPETRRRVVEHIATCAECCDVVLAANAMREAAASAVVPFRRRHVLIGVAAAAAIAAIALFLSPLREQIAPQNKSGLAALAAAAPPERNIEGRLSGFPYRPFKTVMRGGADEDDTSPEHLKLLAVAAQVAADAKKNPTPENLHAYGVSLLMLGKWDAAVNALEEALRKESGEEDVAKAIQKCTDVALLSDLSAAYLARERTENHSHDFPLAVEVAERAWSLSKTAETAWNRALALAAVGIKIRAQRAWRDYIALDPNSEWSNEARRHLNENGRHPESSSLWYPCRKNWMRAITTATADELSRLAAEIRTNCGDTSLSDLIEQRNSALDVSRLVHRALDDFYRQDFSSGASAAASANAIAVNRYPIASAESQLIRGLCLTALGDPVTATASYRDALRSFRATHDAESEAHLNAALADAQEYLGNNDEAWRFRLDAVRILARAPRSGYSFSDFAASAANEHLYATAEHLVDEFLAAPADTSPGRLGDAHCLRAALAVQTGKADASRELQLATQFASLVQLPGERERLNANIAFVRGLTGNNRGALNDALAYYRAGGNALMISRLLYARGIGELKAGDFAAAETDLSESVAEAERQAAQFQTNDDQLSFLATTSDIYDAAIAAQLKRGQYATALEYSDRARTFMFRTRSNPERDLSRHMKPDAAVVVYSVLPNELAIWTVTQRGTQTSSVPIESGRLALLTRLALASRDEGVASQHVRELSSVLIPDRIRLYPLSKIIFVPDKFLRSVPFASLLCGDRFLIERAAVSVAPAASLLIHKPTVGTRSVLAVSDGGVAMGADFPKLDEADGEVDEVVKLFPTRQILRGPACTPSAFKRLAERVDVVHYAGHAVYDPKHPLRSALVLRGGDNEAPRFLTAGDVAQAKMRASLIVLSACSTGKSLPYAIPNIAYACLVGGAKNVVATLDAVPDATSKEFVIAFHRSFIRTHDAAVALRDAQLARLHSRNLSLQRPSLWDSYVAFTTELTEGNSHG